MPHISLQMEEAFTVKEYGETHAEAKLYNYLAKPGFITQNSAPTLRVDVYVIISCFSSNPF